MLGRQANSQLRSSPTFGFGTAERGQNLKQFISKAHDADKYGMASPGPVYSPKTLDGRYHSAPSYSLGISHRYGFGKQERSGGKMPGPGQYAMPSAVSRQHDSQKHSYASWKFGTSTRNDQAKVYVSQEHAKSVTEYIESPGPAVYGHRGGLGTQPDSRKADSAVFGMGTSARFFYEKSHVTDKAYPGPGTYKLGSAQGRQYTSDRRSAPKPAFTKADRDRTAQAVYLGPDQQQALWGKNSPGPAVYSPTNSVGRQISSRRPNVPKFGFGTADRFGYISITQRAHQSPGPGAYSI